MLRSLAVLIPVAVAALASGCSSHRQITVGGEPVDGVRLPRLGKTVGPEFWTAAQAIPGDEAIVIEEYDAIPYLHYRKRRIQVDEYRERASLSTYRMVYAGIPEVFLPLFFRSSKTVYKEGSPQATGRAVRHYNPLYSNSSLTGFVGTEPRFMAGGMPLLVDVGTEYGPAWYFLDNVRDYESTHRDSFLTSFWWLGPAYVDREGTRVKSDGVYATRTKAFAPLLAGKTPGLIAWSHYTTTTDAPDGTSTTYRGHGPFGGLLLAVEREVEHPQEPRNLVRLLLGGILWTDIESGDRGAADYRSSRGLLWSAFGYGRENTEVWSKRQVRLFWLPITYRRDYRAD